MLLIYVFAMGLNFRLSFLSASSSSSSSSQFLPSPRLDNNNTNRGGHNIGHERWFGQWCLNLSTLPGGLVSSPEKQKIPTGTLFVHPTNCDCDVYPPRPSPAVFITSSARTKEDGLSSIPSWRIHLDVLRSILHSGRVHRSR